MYVLAFEIQSFSFQSECKFRGDFRDYLIHLYLQIISLHLLKGPFKGRSHWGSPVQLGQDTGALGGWGRKGGGAERALLHLFLESYFPPHWGCQCPPGTQQPLPTEPHRAAQHLSLLPASPSAPRRLSDRAPERSRVAPPLAASPQPTRPPTRRRQGLRNPTAEGCRARPPRLLPGLPAGRAGDRFAAQRVD